MIEQVQECLARLRRFISQSDQLSADLSLALQGTNYEGLIDAPEIDISSTMIRHRLTTGGTLKFLLPEGVEAYIRKEGLYGSC